VHFDVFSIIKTNREAGIRVLEVAANSDGAVVKIPSLKRGQQVQLQARIVSGPFFSMTTGDFEIPVLFRTHVVYKLTADKSKLSNFVHKFSNTKLNYDQLYEVNASQEWMEMI
jgi:hypothetical protein